MFGGPMRRRTFQLISLVGALSGLFLMGFPARAQEGHPLTGSWSGDWGPSLTQRNNITIVMDWEGDKIGGFVLLGANSIPISNVVVDVTKWTVRLEAKGKDASGPVEIAAEGQLENIGSAHRTITGSWRQGTTKGDFKITRD
jgi:hypothetical protein